MAVAGQLSMTPQAIAAALTVDNLLGLVYFPLMAFLGRGSMSNLVSIKLCLGFMVMSNS